MLDSELVYTKIEHILVHCVFRFEFYFLDELYNIYRCSTYNIRFEGVGRTYQQKATVYSCISNFTNTCIEKIEKIFFYGTDKVKSKIYLRLTIKPTQQTYSQLVVLQLLVLSEEGHK